MQAFKQGQTVRHTNLNWIGKIIRVKTYPLTGETVLRVQMDGAKYEWAPSKCEVIS